MPETAEFFEAKTKEEFIDNFKRARNIFFQSVKGLSDADLEEAVTGEFSVKDLMAHILEWDWSALNNSKIFLAGGDPDFSPNEDNDAFNAIAVSIWRSSSGSQVLAELKKSTQAVLDYVETLTDEELFRDRGLLFEGKVVNLPWFLGEFEHDAGHADEIFAWREKNG